ncbi:HNH endonuclease [Phycicoccus jejuensis]|uniref:HNH endonuclease n=1 Tax=Phycicoccus jejuensis TaxID=367299 RepID=UPI00384AFE78
MGVAAGVASRSAAASVTAFRTSLADVPVDELDDRERIDLLTELERLKGAVAAAQARATDAFRRSHEAAAPQDAGRSVGSQVALARHESPTLGDRFVGMSRALVHEMPATMAALTDGDIGERHALEVVRETATLTHEDRAEADRRLAGVLPRLGPRAAGRAARRVAAELDAASVVRRMEAAAASRRVSVRAAPDGMAWLTVLAPLRDAVGAYAAVRARAQLVVGGGCDDEAPDGRGLGAVMADTATRLLAGLAVGQVQPVEVHLVMTDRSLFGTGDPAASVDTPARIPGHGSVPAPVARRWVRNAGDASVWLRRLYASPDARDLVAMDARRRLFTGLLRRMVVLRDDVCANPWCDSLVAHADHVHPVCDGGPTSLVNAAGLCARCNLVKESPGWQVVVVRGSPHELEVRTPTGHRHRSLSPPLLGWGSDPPPDDESVLEGHLAALLDAA